MVGVITGRLLILIGIINFLLLFAFQVFASEVQIVETRKNLQLKDSDKVYRDYYINAGSENGIKSDMTFQVYRKTAVNDIYQSNSRGGTVLLPVGKIKIIYSQTKLSVGRVLSINKAAEGPIVDFGALMVGDVLDVGSVEIEKTEEKITKKPKKTASKDSSKKPTELPKKVESTESIVITPPVDQMEISKSMPVEILQNNGRSPASISVDKPIRVLR